MKHTLVYWNKVMVYKYHTNQVPLFRFESNFFRYFRCGHYLQYTWIFTQVYVMHVVIMFLWLQYFESSHSLILIFALLSIFLSVNKFVLGYSCIYILTYKSLLRFILEGFGYYILYESKNVRFYYGIALQQ